jgi:hypothetical protein
VPSLPRLPHKLQGLSTFERAGTRAFRLLGALACAAAVLAGGTAAGAEPDRGLSHRLALYGLAAGADVASTHWAESRGALEGNPLMRHHGARYALNAASVPALALLDRELERRDKRLMWALRGLRFAVLGFAVAQNLRQR